MIVHGWVNGVESQPNACIPMAACTAESMPCEASVHAIPLLDLSPHR